MLVSYDKVQVREYEVPSLHVREGWGTIVGGNIITTWLLLEIVDNWLMVNVYVVMAELVEFVLEISTFRSDGVIIG